jgi:hypothetical protein
MALSDEMSSFSLDAVADARVNHGTVLDNSPESVRFVEAILEKLHKAQPQGFFQRAMKKAPSPAALDKLAKMYGGYIGEIIRKEKGGEWEYDEQTAPGYRLLSLKTPAARIFPPLRVHRRLTVGSEENVWHYFQALVAQK